MPRTAEDDDHEPNSYGFSGGATAPEPTASDKHPSDLDPDENQVELEAERIAIPDDLAELFDEGDDPGRRT